MSITERSAETTWEGNLARGQGAVTPSSGAFESLPVTWASRTESPDGKTSPEDLGPTVVSSALVVRGAVPGLDVAGFLAAVDEATDLCLISRLFAGATVTVTGQLEST